MESIGVIRKVITTILLFPNDEQFMESIGVLGSIVQLWRESSTSFNFKLKEKVITTPILNNGFIHSFQMMNNFFY